MQRYAKFLAIFITIALLFLQWSGLHFHVDMKEQANPLHVLHIHHIDADSDDHDCGKDVSLLELAGGWFKQIHYVLFAAITLALFSIVAYFIRQPPPYHHHYHRQAYWRPILRAPPVTR